jgi:hypothetical protein
VPRKQLKKLTGSRGMSRGREHRPGQLLGFISVGLHIEEVTDANETIDVVVIIFNHLNRGANLSKGDLALAKIRLTGQKRTI